MLFLYVFGTTLEKEFSAGKMLGAFFIGGIFSFISSAFFYGMESVMIGASAAIFTVMAIVMLTKPLRFSWLFFMPLGLVAILYLLFNIVAAYYVVEGTVGYLAHIIGFLIGFGSALSIILFVAWQLLWRVLDSEYLIVAEAKVVA